MNHTRIIERMRRLLPEALEAAEVVRGRPGDEIMARVKAEFLPETARILRDDPELAFTVLVGQLGADYGDYLGVIVILYSRLTRARLTLKALVPRESAEIDSLVPVFKGASWYERETFEMFGIRFRGHGNLRRLLLPDDWEGWPLRKNYAPPTHYGGIELARPDLLDTCAAPCLPEGVDG